jgi:Tfp pilus assembly protein PilF
VESISPKAADARWYAHGGLWLSLALAFVANIPILWQGFVWDDFGTLERFRMIGPWMLLDAEPFGYIRPGKVFLQSCLYAIFGEWVPGWQAFALAVILLATAAVYRLALEVGCGRLATMAACLYGVHPHQIESNWLSALNGTVAVVLMGCLYIMIAGRCMGASGWRPLAALAVIHVISVLFKEDAAVLPLMGLLVLWFRGERPSRAAWLSIVGSSLIVVSWLVWSRLVAASVGQEKEPLPFPYWAAPFMWPGTMAAHFGWFIAPFRWMYYQPLPVGGFGFILFSVFAAAVTGEMMLRGLRRRSTAALGAALGVVALLPVANVIPMGNSHCGVRYLAGAGVGFSILIAALVVGACDNTRRLRPWLLIGLVGWLAAATWMNWQWRADWSSNDRLFARLVKESNNPLHHRAYARVLTERGEFAEAMPHLRLALSTTPPRADDHVALGVALRALGDESGMLQAFAEAARLSPQSPELAIQMADLHEQRWSSTGSQEDFAAAVAAYELAQRARTANGEVAFNNHGILWAQVGDVARAVAIWSAGLERFPNSADLKRNLEIAGRRGSARQPQKASD